MKRKEIANALGVSEKTIERLIPVSKIKGKRAEIDKQFEVVGAKET